MELGAPCLRATQRPGTKRNPGLPRLRRSVLRCIPEAPPLPLRKCLETESLTQEPHHRSCMDSCGFFSTLLKGGSGPPRILPGWSPSVLVNMMGPHSGTRRFPALWPQGRNTENKQVPAQSLFTREYEGRHGPGSPLEGRGMVLRVWTEG